ncbi:class I SAM-dependent methyltransferase [Streptomyces calidiresistens]|uniref:Methyltransferase domain-containing protein n=1 Tax=Streptomyces calidiresistens TaxID=1485586 RepID=A0A7W3XVY8_9ACTN|nr:methyltransferase domain-containing protein [Streptomyces calidiresistens]MBB0229236.1 methyltransferase domain-containing protein [Streptomyces calidiresistens]
MTGFDHNDRYHRLLLRQVPVGCRTALDVGCGTGRFARRLAERGIVVDAVDRSATVIRAARARGEHPGLRFHHRDLVAAGPPGEGYDFISCLASLHHMPFATLGMLRDALAPRGVLAVLGCHRDASVGDWMWSLAAVPVNAGARLALAGRAVLPSQRGGALDQAGRTRRTRRTGRRGTAAETVSAPVVEPRMTLEEIRREAADPLPGFTLRRLLLWRHLLLYRAPTDH